MSTSTIATGTAERSRPAALLAIVVGAALIFVVGFAHASTLHNAGHDTRHALAFPCH